MTRRDWWLGILLVSAAVFAHAAFPRYEYRHPAGAASTKHIRIDRWTGASEWGEFATSGPDVGRWVGVRERELARQRAHVEFVRQQQQQPPQPAKKTRDIELHGTARIEDIVAIEPPAPSKNP